MLSFKGVKEMASEEWLFQLPLFALVSICSGALGALFNALHKMLRRVSTLLDHLFVHAGNPPFAATPWNLLRHHAHEQVSTCSKEQQIACLDFDPDT